MHARRPARMLAGLIVLGAVAAAEAQTPSEGRWYAGVKAGANHEEAEDGLSGTTGAGAVAVGFPLGRSWSGEVELWLPGAITNAAGDPAHRDILVSFSAIRFFAAGRARPYLAAGASVARTEDRLTTCIADRVPAATPAGGNAGPAIVDCSEPDVRERRTERFTSASAYVLGGAGVEVPLGSRLRLALELRVHAAPPSVIVRPAAGVIVAF